LGRNKVADGSRNGQEAMEVQQGLGITKPFVLVIDDDCNEWENTATALAQANLTCLCRSTAQEALEAARNTTPDLILCDLNVRGENGWKIVGQIRHLPGLEDVPAMFLSQTQLPDIIRRSFGSYCTYCIRKPFDSSVLVELIDRVLGAAEA
jgi:CheY-like chemotaxis protein